MKPIVKIIATGVIGLAALGMIAYKYFDYMKYPWTRDGLVRAQVVQIATRVTGPLVRVPVQNNQLVKKGDLLFEIDPSTFQATVNLARAQFDNMSDIVRSLADQVAGLKSNLAQRQAEISQAKSQIQSSTVEAENLRIIFQRAKELRVEGINSQMDFDNKSTAYQVALVRLSEARAKMDQTTAALRQAEDDLARGLADLGEPGPDNPRLRRAAADLELAQLNLDFTKVRAPVDGYVTNLQLHAGDSAAANQPVLALIDANSFYVQAFFRETFVGDFQKGDRAVVTLMSYPDTPLEGRVDSIGWGIAQQNGSTGFEQLPTVKPTFEWIRLAQRLPVMVRIEKVPNDIELRAGTTASVVVITGTSTSRNGGQVPPVPRVLQ
jgi:multidrug resistance efflux pump